MDMLAWSLRWIQIEVVYNGHCINHKPVIFILGFLTHESDQIKIQINSILGSSRVLIVLSIVNSINYCSPVAGNNPASKIKEMLLNGIRACSTDMYFK